jgi:hypothetical protein
MITRKPLVSRVRYIWHWATSSSLHQQHGRYTGPYTIGDRMISWSLRSWDAADVLYTHTHTSGTQTYTKYTTSPCLLALCVILEHITRHWDRTRRRQGSLQEQFLPRLNFVWSEFAAHFGGPQISHSLSSLSPLGWHLPHITLFADVSRWPVVVSWFWGLRRLLPWHRLCVYSGD